MESEKFGKKLLIQKMMLLETFADLIKSEIYNLRETLGRVDAPTSISKKKKDHFATVSKILANRQKTIWRRQNSTDSDLDGNRRT